MMLRLTTAREFLQHTTVEAIRQSPVSQIMRAVGLIVAGCAALAYPLFFQAEIMVAAGGVLGVLGLIQLAALFGPAPAYNLKRRVIMTAFAIGGGIVLMAYPLAGLNFLTVALSFYFLFDGAAKVFFTLKLRPFPDWQRHLASGGFSLAVGLLIWAFASQVSPWPICVLVAYQLLLEGITLAFLIVKSRFQSV